MRTDRQSTTRLGSFERYTAPAVGLLGLVALLAMVVWAAMRRRRGAAGRDAARSWTVDRGGVPACLTVTIARPRL